MLVIKPQALGLSTRPIEYRKRFGLCVTASLYVPFEQPPGGALWTEQSMWNFLGQEMAVPAIDEGIAKLTPEFLVHGRAHPPGGQASACAVRARLGGRDKTLLVFGDRYWDGDRPSEPRSFDVLPIDWSRAYGGPDHAANAMGRGRTSDGGVQWLPNIEAPADRLVRRDQAPSPAGFGPVEPMHPRRARFRGTYDADYLREHSPGFAPDLDWRHFNLAPDDQWFEQPLQGDEPFAFENMHPEHAHLEGRLPGLCARAFASYRMPHGEAPGLREVPLRLTTVWFFPHAERAVLLFQGLAEIATDDGSDVLGLTAAVERCGDRRSDAHYADAIERRGDPRMGAVHALDDSDLLPEGIDVADPAQEAAQQAFAVEGLQADAQYRRAETEVLLARDEAQAQGRDPDALGLTMPPREKVPTGAALAPYLKTQLARAEREQWASLEDVVTQVEKALDFAASQKVPLAALQHRGPPRFGAEARLDQLIERFAQAGTSIDQKSVYARLVQQEAAEREGYRQSAHLQPPVDPMPEAQAATLRGEITRALAIGLRDFSGLDFTGADFSRLDLRGINLAQAWLERASFAGSNLSGANLRGAVMAHCDLRDAIAVGADLSSANLGRAALARCVLDEAVLTGCILDSCVLDGTQLRRTHLAGARILDMTWRSADATGLRAGGQLFHKLDLKTTRLQEAELADACFVECDLQGCDLRAARLQRTNFVGCQLDGAQLQGADARGAVFVQACSLQGADLTGALLAGCNLGEAQLDGAVLAHARLDGANLTAASLAGCDLRAASAKGALLRRANLRNARMAGINLQDAMLQHADLRGADLRASNLFGADLSRVRLDGDVQLADALLKRARTWPRLSPQQQAAA